MSIDYNRPTTIDGNEPSGSLEPVGALTETPMISATPIWETRGKKRRGLSASRPVAAPLTTPDLAETRTFDTVAPTSAMETSATAGYALEPESTLSGAPVGYTATTRPIRTKSNYAPAAIAVGVLALAGVGAAGLMASQHNDRVPELTPGVASSPVVAANNVVAPPPVVQRAAPARSTPAPMRTATATPRIRPAAASAGDLGVNTSARIPSGPQPYASAAPAAQPTQAAPTPEPIPATPPVQTQEAPAPATATPDPTPAPAETPVPPTN